MLYALCMYEGVEAEYCTLPPSSVWLRFYMSIVLGILLVEHFRSTIRIRKRIDASPKHSYPQQEPSAEGYVIKARGSTKQEGRSNEASTAGSRLGNASLSASDVAVHSYCTK